MFTLTSLPCQLNDEIGLLAADLMIAELRRILGESQSQLGEAPTPASQSLQAAAEARALEQVLLFDSDTCGPGHALLTVSPSATSNTTVDPPVTAPHPELLEEPEELSEKELDTELSIATSAALSVQRGEGELLSLAEGDEGGGFVVVVSPSEVGDAATGCVEVGDDGETKRNLHMIFSG